MKFEKVRVIDAGLTTNSWEQDGKTAPIFITPESLDSLVERANQRPVHCRKTHAGYEMLNEYIGSLDNFIREGDSVFADLTISPALEDGYPEKAKFIIGLIEKEPEMIGMSVFDIDTKEFNEKENRFDVTSFERLIACDIVGIPAATSSMFNNQNNEKMSKYFSNFASIFKKATKCAEEIVDTTDGKKIKINSKDGLMNIGDEVTDIDGNPYGDGEVTIEVPGEGRMVLVISDSKIEKVREYEEAEGDKEETIIDRQSSTPAEFSERLNRIEQSIEKLASTFSSKFDDVNNQLKKTSATPTQFSRNDANAKQFGKITKESVKEAQKKYEQKY